MLYLFPLVHYPSIDYSSKRKFEIIAIPDILNSFPMFIYNGVNLQELNSQIAVLKPLILPKSNSFSISYPPSKIHASCLCSPFTPLPKGGTLSVFNTKYIWRPSLVFVVYYILLEFVIYIMVPLDP
jgi:hypothetical protein